MPYRLGMSGLVLTIVRLPTLITLLVILVLSLVLLVDGPAGAEEGSDRDEAGGEQVGQLDNPVEVEEEVSTEDILPDTVVQPISGGWSLLANTGPASTPPALLAPLDQLATAAFTFDAEEKRFHSFYAGQPGQSDLTLIGEGEAFWIFVPPARLDGDLALLGIPTEVRGTAVELQPGFTLVGWTGSDGVRISEAMVGLPVRRVFSWEVAAQQFAIWDPLLPAVLREDFTLEYGAGLWVDLGGTEVVVWDQP